MVAVKVGNPCYSSFPVEVSSDLADRAKQVELSNLPHEVQDKSRAARCQGASS